VACFGSIRTIGWNLSPSRKEIMEIKQQTIILKIKYDPAESFEPRLWHWAELLKCKDNCVEILNYGKVETVDKDD